MNEFLGSTAPDARAASHYVTDQLDIELVGDELYRLRTVSGVVGFIKKHENTFFAYLGDNPVGSSLSFDGCAELIVRTARR